MAIQSTDLIGYAALNMPADDTSAVGGAIDPTVRISFGEPSLVNDEIEIVSSNFLDVRPLAAVTVMTTAGFAATETLALNGIVPVDFASVGPVHHIESVLLSQVAQGVVTVRRASDRVLIAQIPAGEVGFRRMFQGAFAAASPKTYYEKLFLKNTNPTAEMASGFVSLETADPFGYISFCVASAINDNGGIVNRLTAPAAGILAAPGLFTTTTQNIPGSSVLNPGDAIGVWYKLTAPAGIPPAHASWQVAIGGQVPTS